MSKTVMVAFLLAACLVYASGRWDGQFVANPAGPSKVTSSTGADACVKIPPNAYLQTTCPGTDAYVGVGKLKPDGGIDIGTGNGCLDRDGGVSCAVVLFSIGAPSFTQAGSDSNRACVHAMDGGVVTCFFSVCQN